MTTDEMTCGEVCGSCGGFGWADTFCADCGETADEYDTNIPATQQS